MREWFLAVDMFTQLHDGQGGNGMNVIRSGNRRGINIFMFLIQHFPEVLVEFGFGKAFPGIRGAVIIHITKRHDIYFRAFRKMFKIILTLSAGADGGYVEFITGCNETAAQYMTRNDRDGAHGKRSVPDKIPSGDSLFFNLHNWFIWVYV